MSEQLFEVAFSGEIIEGASLEQVKAKVGAMFKADEAKLAHLFSGKRMVIKKNIDQATANKYKAALNKAGAVCEIKSLSEAPLDKAPAADAPASPPVETKVETSAAQTVQTAQLATETVSHGDIPAAPQTAPLGVTANDISDLAVNIAPVGSDMQDEIKEVAEPALDISGLDIAPVGSDLGEVKKGETPPPPDTSGLTLAE